MTTLMAEISGSAVVHLLIWVICIGTVFYLLHWLIGYVGLQDPWNKVAKIILAVAAVILLINALLTLAGHPFIRW